MLTYNPSMRWTASKCLQQDLFDEIRQNRCEEPSKNQVFLPLYKQNSFDYTENTSKHKIEDMKKMLVKEVKKIQINLNTKSQI